MTKRQYEIHRAAKVGRPLTVQEKDWIDQRDLNLSQLLKYGMMTTVLDPADRPELERICKKLRPDGSIIYLSEQDAKL